MPVKELGGGSNVGKQGKQADLKWKKDDYYVILNIFCRLYFFVYNIGRISCIWACGYKSAMTNDYRHGVLCDMYVQLNIRAQIQIMISLFL